MFQSTHPHGVRHTVTFGGNEEILFQSTHPHGVRPSVSPTGLVRKNGFQSTHPHGVRLHTVERVFIIDGFNPRTHTGCDVAFDRVDVSVPGFNPRTHTGCDKIPVEPHIVPMVSIHAPTRGATASRTERYSGKPVSIHAPTRGATVCKVTYYKSIN